jgi:hypothetical protein
MENTPGWSDPNEEYMVQDEYEFSGLLPPLSKGLNCILVVILGPDD